MERIIELATQYGRYGYRGIIAMLRQERWQDNHQRVERIWRRVGEIHELTERCESSRFNRSHCGDS